MYPLFLPQKRLILQSVGELLGQVERQLPDFMQNRYLLEGWLTANFIAMIAYHKLISRIREAQNMGKYSPKDIIELSKSIYKLKINDQWKTSDITKKNLSLFKKIKIDYLN